jgi:hypothetical protein
MILTGNATRNPACTECGRHWNPRIEASPGEVDGICAECFDAAHPPGHDCQTCLDLYDDAAEERAIREAREVA